MKTFAGVLLCFALGGLGLALVILATNGFHQSTTISGTIEMIGLIALSGATITMAVDEARKEQVARLDKIAALLETK